MGKTVQLGLKAWAAAAELLEMFLQDQEHQVEATAVWSSMA
jgi:hypothetical protein